jgi:hypothetical protein
MAHTKLVSVKQGLGNASPLFSRERPVANEHFFYLEMMETYQHNFRVPLKLGRLRLRLLRPLANLAHNDL